MAAAAYARRALPDLRVQGRKYQKKWYHERKKNGLCIKCGKPAMEGHVMCEKCRTALNARLKAARDAYRQREAKT